MHSFIPIKAVLFDFNGVIRHIDPEFTPDLERRFDLAAGSIHNAAFSQPLLSELTTGEISRQEWLRQIGEHVGSPEAAVEWGTQPSWADPELLSFVEELRSQGLTTAVLTNGTDEVRAEADQLDVLKHFDAFFNSADIGVVKPDPRAFQHVLDELGLSGSEVFFTDDSENKLIGARELGIPSHHYTSTATLRDALSQVRT